LEFDYDPVKSRTNKEKHGIDFQEAQELWTDPMLVEVPAKTVDEARYLIIGRIGARIWSAVVTYRENKTRIISVRRSRIEEVRIHESA